MHSESFAPEGMGEWKNTLTEARLTPVACSSSYICRETESLHNHDEDEDVQ